MILEIMDLTTTVGATSMSVVQEGDCVQVLEDKVSGDGCEDEEVGRNSGDRRLEDVPGRTNWELVQLEEGKRAVHLISVERSCSTSH
jgi:hypothetical protein